MSAYKLLESLLPYLEAALPLSQALQFSGQQNPKIQKTAKQIQTLIERGYPLSLCLQNLNPSKELLSWIEFSEQSGNLSQGIQSALRLKQSRENAKRLFLSTLRYPLSMLSLLLISLVILQSSLIPSLQKLYGETALPWITQIIFEHPYALTLLSSSFPLSLLGFFIPLKKMQTRLQNCEQLRLKLQAGISLMDSVPPAWKTLIARGYAFSIVLEIYQQDPFFIQMARLGETTGDLPRALEQAESIYRQQEKQFLTRIQTLLPGILLIFMGGLLGTVIIGLYWPMLNFQA